MKRPWLKAKHNKERTIKLTTEIPTTDAQFKGLSISRVKEGTLYKYYYGSYTSYADAQKALRTVKTKLSSAYVVATVNGKSVSVAEARAKEQEKK